MYNVLENCVDMEARVFFQKSEGNTTTISFCQEEVKDCGTFRACVLKKLVMDHVEQ